MYGLPRLASCAAFSSMITMMWGGEAADTRIGPVAAWNAVAPAATSSDVIARAVRFFEIVMATRPFSMRSLCAPAQGIWLVSNAASS